MYSKPNVLVFLLFNLTPNVTLSFIKHIPTELSATKERSPARTLLGAQTFDEEWKNELGFKAQTLTDRKEPVRRCQLSIDVCGSSSNGVEVRWYKEMRGVGASQLGMSSALGTLCGQSYGAKQYHMLGVYLQRSWIVMFIASIFLLPLFIFTTPILKLLGQSDSMAYIGGEVGRWLISTLFAFIVSFTCQMYLQSQSKNMIITYLAAVTIVIHIFLSWLLTVKYKLGIPGAMLSTVFAFWIPNIGQLIYVMCGACRDTWKGFSLLAFKDLWPVVKLSLSSGVMLCLELWYYTALVLITGYLKNSEVSIDALTICLNINGWEMMISLGFMSAASVRVGNELGRGSSKAAKFSIVVTVFTSFVIGFVLFLFFLFLKGRIAYIFTENEEVVEAIADLSPLLAVSILLNSVQPVLSGVAVGAGWQSIVAYVNVVSYYIVGVPIGLVLGYVFDMGVKGVWMGMLFGTFVQTIALVIVTYKTNWDEQVIVARIRVKKWAVDDAQEPELTTSDVS